MFASQFLPRFVTTGILAAFDEFRRDAANALYDVGPGEIPGKPGSIIRVWPLEGGGPGMGGSGGEAFRILYRSTDPSGRPIPVSGAIYIPAARRRQAAATSSPGRTRPPASCRLARRR